MSDADPVPFLPDPDPLDFLWIRFRVTKRSDPTGSGSYNTEIYSWGKSFYAQI